MEVLLWLDGAGRLSRGGHLLLCLRDVVQQPSDFIFATHGELLLLWHFPDPQRGGVGQLEVVAGDHVSLVLVHLHHLVFDPRLRPHDVHLQFVQHVSAVKDLDVLPCFLN